MARRSRLAAPLLFSFLVTACAAPDPRPTTSPPPPSEPVETPADQGLPDQTIQPPPLPNSALLLGLEPRQVQAVLGTPSLVRREGAAQVMQFKNGNCILDVIFYEESGAGALGGGAFRAEHLSSRMTDGAPIPPRQCLAAILPGGHYPVGLFPEEIEPAPEPES